MIYIYICMCVRVCVCVFMCLCVQYIVYRSTQIHEHVGYVRVNPVIVSAPSDNNTSF